MATYKHQLNLYGGSSEGYVKYNISPEIGTYVAPGESVTVTGQAYSRDAAIYGMVMTLFVGQWGASSYRSVDVAQKAVKISKGKTGTFTLTFTLPEGAANMDTTSDRGFDAKIEFLLADSAELASGSSTTSASAQAVSILKNRTAPVINFVEFGDETTAFARFGSFVQDESQIEATIQTQVDSIDPTVAIVSRELTLGGILHSLPAATGSLGPVNLSGAVSWTLKVTDNKGLSAESSGSIQVLPYAKPSISTLTAQRYREVVADDGTVSYVQSDDGEHVRFTLAGQVAQVAGANAWTLKIAYGTATRTALSGTDGATIARTDDRTLVTSAISLSERVEFTFTLTDFFHSVSMVAAVDKAGAYFNVEKTGVSAGMRSTGTVDNPLFESAYPGKFYAGLDSAVKKHVFEDSDFSEYFQQNTTDFPLTICRFGPVVVIGGAFSVKKAPSSSSQVLCLTLPDWAVPMMCIDAMQFGNGTFHWRARAHTDGHLYARKFLTSNGSASTPAAGESYNLSMSWIAADAMEVE